MARRCQPQNAFPSGVCCLRGRLFSQDDLQLIRVISESAWEKGRSAISRRVCAELAWRQPNGRLKDRACRDVLLKLEAAGYLKLPPRLSSGRTANDGRPASERFHVDITSVRPRDMITHYEKPRMVMVRHSDTEVLWNTLVATYHYLGYNTIVGRHLKYIAYYGKVPIACLGWGDPARAVRCRDEWIGWSAETRERNRQLIVNNVRFLILPWVHVPNLASTLLGLSARILKREWTDYYGLPPVLLETFVEQSRFRGTSYRAANWTLVGQTTGNGKCGSGYFFHGKVRDVYVYPLCRNWRTRLCENEDGTAVEGSGEPRTPRA